MSIFVPSRDLVAISLLFAGFDLDMSMAEVIKREQRYEDDNECHFGVCWGDFSAAFYLLAMELGDELRGRNELPDDCDLDDLVASMKRTTLRQWIPRILRFNDHGTKDTESFWNRDEELAGSEWDFRAYNRPFREFFAEPSSLSQGEVIAFYRSIASESRPLEAYFSFGPGRNPVPLHRWADSDA